MYCRRAHRSFSRARATNAAPDRGIRACPCSALLVREHKRGEEASAVAVVLVALAHTLKHRTLEIQASYLQRPHEPCIHRCRKCFRTGQSLGCDVPRHELCVRIFVATRLGRRPPRAMQHAESVSKCTLATGKSCASVCADAGLGAEGAKGHERADTRVSTHGRRALSSAAK